MKKSQGVALAKWIGQIPKEKKGKVPFLVWREFWNDDFTPEEALLQADL